MNKQIAAVVIWWGLHCALYGVQVRARYKALPHWVTNIVEFLDVKVGPVLMLLVILWVLQ